MQINSVIFIYEYFDPVVVQVVTSFTVNYLFVNLLEFLRCSPNHATKVPKALFSMTCLGSNIYTRRSNTGPSEGLKIRGCQ